MYSYLISRKIATMLYHNIIKICSPLQDLYASFSSRLKSWLILLLFHAWWVSIRGLQKRTLLVSQSSYCDVLLPENWLWFFRPRHLLVPFAKPWYRQLQVDRRYTQIDKYWLRNQAKNRENNTIFVMLFLKQKNSFEIGLNKCVQHLRRNDILFPNLNDSK